MKTTSHFQFTFLKASISIILFLLITIKIYPQNNLITINRENVPLAEILQEIKLQSGMNLLYKTDLVDQYPSVSIHLERSTLTNALGEALKNTLLQWRIVEGVIIIESRKIVNEQTREVIPLTQIIRGRVTDLNTGAPLVGANIILSGSSPIKGTVSDPEGYYELDEIPVGRQTLEASFVGYHSALFKNIYIISGKEFILDIKLEEKIIQGDEVQVKAFSRKDLPLNEMAQVGARSFSVEETERYAGSIGDPSRMAASYAGVLTLGTQVNDIIIRGNSTNALLWRMEGLKVPNPNHFGDISSSGGTASMLNNNVLGNSDFYTGAFPAEFGNAQSGIFDLKLRKGNPETREYLAQIGFGGIEFGAEGPITASGKASYIANYRYSTIGIFDLLGLDIGVFAVPVYQDASFNINIPTKKYGKFSLFGLGGYNRIKDNYYDATEQRGDTTDYSSYMGFTGINHLYFFSEKSSLSTSIGLSRTQNRNFMHLNIEGQIKDFIWLKNYENTIEFKTEYKNKLNSKNYLKFGFDYHYADFNLRDSLYSEYFESFLHTLDIQGYAGLIQSYGQWKHRFNNSLSMVAGIHYQYSSLGDDHALEPRLSIKWDLNQKHSLGIGGGMYSKMQPHFIYYKEELLDTLNKIYHKPNKDLEMTRNMQAVLSYNYLINSNLRIKLESYYQYLYHVPVQADSSHQSLLNYGSSFSVYDYGPLVNEGTGYNYGIEFTLEKFLTKGFYYLFTLSLFESKYRGSDQILRSTRFNNNLMCNFLGGYEWEVGRENTFGFDIRVIWALGERRIPLDYEASLARGEAVYIISEAYQERYRDFLRLDTRLYFKLNKKSSHTFSIDIVNATNRQNHFLAMYDAEINDYKEVSTLSIMPAFVWRWNF